MREIDLNCDMGEGFGSWRIGADEALLDFVTSANVACGYHAGDPPTIMRTVQLALDRGVAVGAHPAYPDLQGFGRRSMRLSPDELESILLYQVAAVHGITRALGGTLHHVKLHGALYNDAATDVELARAAIRAVQRLDERLILYALAGSPMVHQAKQDGLRVVEEAFADRRYNADGTLQIRAVSGALITDPETAAAQARDIAVHHQVTSADGAGMAVRAGTICVHGDNPSAVAIACDIRVALRDAGVAVRSPMADAA
jgi:UPF0271 protein